MLLFHEELKTHGHRTGSRHFHKGVLFPEHVFHAVFKEHLEGFVQADHETDGRGVVRLIFGAVLTFADEVEVEAGGAYLFGTSPSPGRERHEGHPGRQHEAFLRTREQAVYAPFIHEDGRKGDGGDAVRHKEHFTFTGDGGYFFYRVQDAGGSFRYLHEDTANTGIGIKGFAHGFGFDSLACGPAELDDIETAHLGDIYPAVAEMSGCGDEHLFTRFEEIEGRGRHGTGAGTGQRDDRAFGTEQRFQHVLIFMHDFFEGVLAVMGQRGGHGKADTVRDGSRSGGEHAGSLKRHGNLVDYSGRWNRKVLR